ncbi:MAG: hypothetical protein LBC93_06865 [Synergistaceae bacterium]|jgi:phage protein D|nr:hypothetical protein [Synergistaceae bacterium]
MSVDTYAPVRYITLAGQELPRNLSDDVLGFSYEDTDSEMDELKLTIQDKHCAYIDDPLLQEGREIRARWGYLGSLSDTRICTIKEIDYDFSADGVVSIALVAYDNGHKLTGRAARTCWKDKSISAIVKEIADKHGLKAEIEVPEDSEREFTSQGGKNDMEFLAQLAAETGCVLKILIWLNLSEKKEGRYGAGTRWKTPGYRRR